MIHLRMHLQDPLPLESTECASHNPGALPGTAVLISGHSPSVREALSLLCFMSKETEPQKTHRFPQLLRSWTRVRTHRTGSRVQACHQAATLLLIPQLRGSAQHQDVHIPPTVNVLGYGAKGNEGS